MTSRFTAQDHGEVWLANRLGQFGHVFAGVTDPALRKQRIREAIREGALENVIAGNRAGKPELFRDCFARLYGEAL